MVKKPSMLLTTLLTMLLTIYKITKKTTDVHTSLYAYKRKRHPKNEQKSHKLISSKTPETLEKHIYTGNNTDIGYLTTDKRMLGLHTRMYISAKLIEINNFNLGKLLKLQY